MTLASLTKEIRFEVLWKLSEAPLQARTVYATSQLHPPHNTPPIPTNPHQMANKMDIDAVNGEREEETVGPAPDLPPERST